MLFNLWKIAHTVRHFRSYLRTIYELHRVEDELKDCRQILREIGHTNRRTHVTASRAQKEYMARRAIEHIIEVSSNPEPETINPVLEYWYGIEDNKIEVPDHAPTP